MEILLIEIVFPRLLRIVFNQMKISSNLEAFLFWNLFLNSKCVVSIIKTIRLSGFLLKKIQFGRERKSYAQ
jgi:hypothetical protein